MHSDDGFNLFAPDEPPRDEQLAELLRRGIGDVPVGAVVSEYVDVAKAFFDGREAGFANGLLDAIGKDVRAK